MANSMKNAGKSKAAVLNSRSPKKPMAISGDTMNGGSMYKKGGTTKKYQAGGSMDTNQVKKYMNTPSTGNKIKPLANPGVDPSKKNAIPQKPISDIVKNYQIAGVVRSAVKSGTNKLVSAAESLAKTAGSKITKFSSEAERIAAGQKPNLQKSQEASRALDAGPNKSYSKKGLEQAIERRTNPAAANKKMTKAQRESFELDNSYRKKGGTIKKKK